MQPNNDNLTPNQPVMDIQRPTSSPQPTVIKPANPLSRPATLEYTRPRPDDPSAPSFAPTPDASRTNISSLNTPPSKKSRRSKKPLIILLVVLLLAGIGGGGAYYYFAVYKKPTPAPVATQTDQTTTQTSDTVEATPNGVDKTIQSIDKTMNGLNDTADFTPNDVSNEGLGL